MFDPFAEDDGFVPGKGRKRPRYSLQREDWRLVDEPDGSEEQEEPIDWEQSLDKELDEADTQVGSADDLMTDSADLRKSIENAVPQESTPVFAKPSLELTGSILERRAEELTNALSQRIHQAQGNLPTDTPQIRPIPSPGLPVPSPLVSDHLDSTGYFPSWTSSEAQEIRSVPTEIATPPESFIEVYEIDTEPVNFHQAGSVELQVYPEQEHVFDAGFPGPDDSGSTLNTGQLLQEHYDELVHSSPAIDEQDFPKVGDNILPLHIDAEVQPVYEAPNTPQPTNVQCLEDAADDHEDHEPHDVTDQVGSEPDIEESSELDIQTVETAQYTAHLDVDALQALESMIGLREKEALERNNSSQEERESEGGTYHSSTATGGLYHGQGEIHNVDDQIDKEDRHLDQSGDDYGSQGDFEEDESDVDKFDDEKPEQEIIVLDSDSEDEHVSHPSQRPSEQEELSPFRSGSTESVVSADESALEGEGEEAESWIVDSEQDDYATVEQESEGDESENDTAESRAYDEVDDRVHDTDNDDGSTLATFEQDKNASMEKSPSIQRLDNEQIHSVIKIESSVKDQNFDGKEPQTKDSHLTDTIDILHQDQSRAVETRAEQVGQPEFEAYAAKHYTADGVAESPLPSTTEINTADLLLDPESIAELPEPPKPHGNLSLNRHQLEHQLLTPELVQDAATSPEIVTGNGLDATSPSHEQEDSADFNEQPEPSLPSGSPALDEDAALHPDDQMDKDHGNSDYEDAVSIVSERSQIIANAEHHPAGAGVVVGRNPSPAPSAVIQPPSPNRYASGLRSKLSYFAPLATLIDHYGALVDTISIVRGASPIARSKAGSRDWALTVELTDPSMAGTTLNAQITRRYKSSMPSLTEGSAILLRDFKVNFKHTFMLVSVESSAWAVFDGSGPEAEINGPPVEYDSEERAYASGLRRWFSEVGSASVADHMLQASIERDSVEREHTPNSEVPSESGSPSSKRGSQRRRRSNRRVTIHELRDGTRYTEVGSPNSRNSSVHELRDGTLYANI